jgi:lipid-A-disaccharide synthase
VTGLTDAITHIPQYARAEKTILKGIQKTKPDLVVLIDNPGFNLHLAKKIHALRIPIVYYISPQIWAWGAKRIFKIKAYVKKMLVVFEFEKKLYEDHGVPVAWVGHPLKDLLGSVPEKRSEAPLVALLPGSRKGELRRLVPVMAAAARQIAAQMPETGFALIKAPTLQRELYAEWIEKEFKGLRCALIEKDHYSVIKGSSLAIVCSGTATLECALLGVPMIITYKGSFLTYAAAKACVRVKHLGLPNLILGEERFPEFLQYGATPEKIASAAVKILKEDGERQSMKKALLEVSKKLGDSGADQRAAREVLSAL